MLHETDVRDDLIVECLAFLANLYKVDAHIANLKEFGAVWYVNVIDHSVAAEALSGANLS